MSGWCKLPSCTEVFRVILLIRCGVYSRPRLLVILFPSAFIGVYSRAAFNRINTVIRNGLEEFALENALLNKL